MALSKYNQRIEVKAVQITGNEQNKAGVYARLLKDLEGKYYNDVRYFGYNEAKATHHETTRGIILNEEQTLALRKALKEFKDYTLEPANG